jgi:hypothetical protein
MRKYLIGFSFVVLIASSCAVRPLIGYKEIKQRPNTYLLDSIVVDSALIPPLRVDNRYRLQLKDSVLVYNDVFYSNYRVFCFKATPAQSYKITINSLCDCLGFRKYMFNPDIRVIDSHGRAITTRLTDSNIDYVKSFQPISFNKTWAIDDRIAGDCFIIVYSNNSKLNRSIYDFQVGTMSGFTPILLPIKITSSLVGDFILRISEK